MKIVMLDGGLFNQVTQYVFARCLELSTGEPVYLDNLFFYSRLVNQEEKHLKDYVDSKALFYQLDMFVNARPHLISNYFDKDVWDEIVQQAQAGVITSGGSFLPKILQQSGLNFYMIAECPTYTNYGFEEINIARYPYYLHIPEMLQAQGNVYYWGYFTNGGWFMDHEDLFRHELQLPPLTREEDLRMADEIRNCYSVAIHIRRGTYQIQGLAAAPEYYKQIIREVLRKYKNKKLRFYVFSDEINYVKEHREEYGLNLAYNDVVFGMEADKRTDLETHCDMQLMSLCKGMILSQSVYSYYAALLNERKDKWVFNPVPSRGVFGNVL